MLGEPLKSVRMESIARVDERALMGHFLVTFKLVGLSPEVTTPVSVSSLHIREDDAIRIARHRRADTNDRQRRLACWPHFLIL
jgi:hypothetical protein